METADKLQALTKEYDRICTDIRAIEAVNDKVIGFGLTIIGGGFAYGIKEDLVPVFFFTPIAIIAIFLYATLQYRNVFWLGGYKRAVEDKINHLAGETLVAWEFLIEKSRGRVSVANSSLLGVYLLFLVASTAFSLYRIFGTMGALIGWTFGVVVLAATCLLLTSVAETMGISCQSYGAARHLLGLDKNNNAHKAEADDSAAKRG